MPVGIKKKPPFWMNAMYPSKRKSFAHAADADLDETAETEVLLDDDVCV